MEMLIICAGVGIPVILMGFIAGYLADKEEKTKNLEKKNPPEARASGV